MLISKSYQSKKRRNVAVVYFLILVIIRVGNKYHNQPTALSIDRIAYETSCFCGVASRSLLVAFCFVFALTELLCEGAHPIFFSGFPGIVLAGRNHSRTIYLGINRFSPSITKSRQTYRLI